jgi:hypothetical protein
MNIFRTWSLKWWEVGLMKICLVSFGIILGLYFHDYLIKITSLWWVLFVVISVYFIPKVFKKENNN